MKFIHVEEIQQQQTGMRSEHEASGTGSFKWLFRLIAFALLVPALMLGAWHVLMFVRHSAAALAVPYPLDGLEGTLLHEAWLLRAGEALYQPLQLDRFVSSPYPPLHYAVLALFTQADGSPHVFFAGRLVSLGAMLVATLALSLTVLRLSCSLTAAFLAMALWLAFAPVQLWATRIKPDPLALAFTALGLLAMTFVNREHGTHNTEHRTDRLLPPVLAAFCFALACFTKQTAVAAPLAAGLALVVSGVVAVARSSRGSDEKGWFDLPQLARHPAMRPALIFGGLYAGLVATTWLALDAVTGGQYTFHVWGLHRSEWWSAALLRKYVELLGPSWPLIVLGVGAMTLAVWRVFTTPGVPSAAALLPACYLLVAPITLLGAGETGANHNHLLEIHLALVLAGTSILGWNTSNAKRKTHNIRHSVLLALLLLQLWTLRERPAWYGGEFDLADTPARYVDFIRSQPGEVLADDVGLLVAAGRPLRYDDPSTMGPAISSGVWDQHTLLAEVAAQRFSAILMPFNASKDTVDVTGRWSPEFIATLREHYKALYRDRITTYVPK